MKILGIDLGTNSIGMTIREDDFFEWWIAYTFNKGVGDGKSGEFSLAAERTKHRSARRLYNSRRYRKWETLRVLIESGFCPLSIEKLNAWKNYKKGVGRVFPVNDKGFSDWIKLDFNGDGEVNYSSPYQLRKELIQEELDLSIQENRYKLGRALYHIAQRRGFKSSRKVGANEKTAVYKGSKETKTIGRNDYEKLINEKGSLGAAFAHLEDKGIRVRNRYTLRKDYEDEANTILNKQKVDADFLINIKKAIFFQRPLRSQKGLVGKCTMESNKPRCPISHPKFEEYRAWSFVNNIKYKTKEDEEFIDLPLSLKKEIIDKQLFIKEKKKEFKTLRNFINKNERKNWILNYKHKADSMTVPTCSVSTYLKDAFGDDWENINFSVTRINKKGEQYNVIYNINDIWHILFHFEDEDYFDEFILETLGLSENQADILKKLWNNFPVGYANLSLKAINNILPFLREGMIYSEAVFLAKIPEIIGRELFENNKEGIFEAIKKEISENQFDKTIINITNSLIANYKGLREIEIFAFKDYEYKLDESDIKDIEKACKNHFGKSIWINKIEAEQELILSLVKEQYQLFFHSQERKYLEPPKLSDRIKQFLIEHFNLIEKQVNKLYHPSMIDIYPSTEDQQYLKSPKTRAFKNPMAYKTLHKLRRVVNYLLETGRIDKDTRIVVEVAKDLNDKNKRSAIEMYQRRREQENEGFAFAISELKKESNFKGNADPNSTTDRRKFRLWTEQIENYDVINEEISKIEREKSIPVSLKDIKKYRLWKEQNAICMYTGKVINITNLFDKNIIDFEHTIPRSKSFDNSLANLTVCYADYNRDVKKNQIPTELNNYKEAFGGYSAIEPRLKKWKKKVDKLKAEIENWKNKSRFAADKDAKDYAVRERHLRQMEYDYWYNKLDRFTREDIPEGFKNSQIIDTQIISKYAYHYLKTVFKSVDVIKGSVNAEFRKIYGIQKQGVLKDRNKHSHHAIDAAVLTLIPSSAKRKSILERAYSHEEERREQYNEKPFANFKYSMIKQIENEILIHNLEDNDKTLLPAKKVIRRRGRVVLFDSEKRIATGDSVRGQLHKETFYGKIKIAEKDDKGTLKRDESGNIIYEQDNGVDKILMVVRKPIENVIAGKKVKTDIIVDENLATFIQKQVSEGVKSDEIKDFQGNTIRRIRCKVKSGRGFMNPDNVTTVKEQTYKSKKEYKNYYYADSGDNYMFGLYEDEKGNRQIKSINLLESVHYSKELEDINKREIFKHIEPVLIGRGKKQSEAKLKHIFEVGQKVLFFLNNKEELKELYSTDKEEFSKRLYKVYRLADANAQRILFQHHLEGRSDNKLTIDFPRKSFGTKGKDGFSMMQTDFIAPRLLLTPSNFNFIIENVDFEMRLDGTVEFKF